MSDGIIMRCENGTHVAADALPGGTVAITIYANGAKTQALVPAYEAKRLGSMLLDEGLIQDVSV